MNGIKNRCNLFLILSDASAQTCSIMDHNESTFEYHHFHFGCSWQSNLPTYYCHLYLCRPRDAIVWKNIHRWKFLSRQSAKVMYIHSVGQKFEKKCNLGDITLFASKAKIKIFCRGQKFSKDGWAALPFTICMNMFPKPFTKQ